MLLVSTSQQISPRPVLLWSISFSKNMDLLYLQSKVHALCGVCSVARNTVPLKSHIIGLHIIQFRNSKEVDNRSHRYQLWSNQHRSQKIWTCNTSSPKSMPVLKSPVVHIAVPFKSHVVGLQTVQIM